MPIITVSILEGRTAEQKRALVENITQAVVAAIAAPPEDVRIIINDMKPENYAIAGLPVLDYRAAKQRASGGNT
jgi:4-oxalocrotonate tautomerase